jgi:hypothetical protein
VIDGVSAGEGSLRSAARYPLRGDPRSLLVAALLAPTVVVPLGYAVAVLRRPAADGHPPSLDPDPDRLVSVAADGALALGLTAAYAAPAAIGAAVGSRPVAAVAAALVAYVAPVAVLRAARGAVADGVALGTLLDVVLTGSCLGAWVDGAVVGSAAAGLAWGVTAVAGPGPPGLVAGVVTGALLGTYAAAVAARRLAVAYERLRDSGAAIDDGTTGVPV